ncbi:hypothetical protein LCGC14_1770000 [marine sediment metagenome]|uniref:PD-(D/E)XK endonuclease-like domain-containing protein n=1 Tax=marine sediment metagenome TaxID=412755 RepID=A0A0F9GYL2_9ZZZZ
MTDLPVVSVKGQELLGQFGLTPKAPPVIDASMLSTFMDCPSKFYLRYVLGLRPRRKDPSKDGNLDWGTCWHETMFAFMEAREGMLKERMVAGLQALEAFYPTYLTPDVDRMKRSKDRMIQQFFAYAKQWIPKEGDYDILRNEQYFDVLGASGLRWCGRMDSLRRVRRNGKIRVWDYKSTKAMGATYFDQFEVSFQFPGYVWATSQMMTDDVFEITVDVMYTVSKDLPPEKTFFERTFRYDAARLLEWETNVLMNVNRILEMLDKYLYQPEMWAKNWGDCTRYGKCRFFVVHSLNPRGQGRLLELRDNFELSRWDPSAVAGEETDQ